MTDTDKTLTSMPNSAKRIKDGNQSNISRMGTRHQKNNSIVPLINTETFQDAMMTMDNTGVLESAIEMVDKDNK